MASSILIPVSEYLTTAYSPDCDFVDGEVQERNVGEYDHGNLQGAIYAALRDMRREWHIRVILELRVQINSSRYRVPDVCVMSADAPREQIIRFRRCSALECSHPKTRSCA
jgi:hypothetical protein